MGIAVAEGVRGRTGRLILVDPHEDSRELYAEYFEWLGIHVTAVPVAADALRVLWRDPADAIVTCLRLPDMDGFSLCDALRAMPHTRRTPVIAVSTCLTDHERALCDMRFAAVLMKPFFPQTLFESLQAALPRREYSS